MVPQNDILIEWGPQPLYSNNEAISGQISIDHQERIACRQQLLANAVHAG